VARERASTETEGIRRPISRRSQSRSSLIVERPESIALVALL
jgi:hypothetical protein